MYFIYIAKKNVNYYKKMSGLACTDDDFFILQRSIDKGGNPVLCRQLQKLLLALYGTDNDRCSQVLLQLTSEGLLSSVINRRTQSVLTKLSLSHSLCCNH